MDHSHDFLDACIRTAEDMNSGQLESLVDALVELRANHETLYIIGLGGSAANASHAASDFRKLCNIRAYCLTDNIAEITARTNDEGFDTIFTEHLKLHSLWSLLVLSVGGGTDKVSRPITDAVRYANSLNKTVLGITGPDGGVTDEAAECCIKIPCAGPWVTPLCESFQMVVLHAIVSHPKLQVRPTKW